VIGARRDQADISLGAGKTEGDHKTQQPLKIIIVGAGIAGLALAGLLGHSGHDVIVLEAAPKIAEVGAGITCSPNLTRLLSRWGLDNRLEKKVDSLTHVNLRRWEGGQFLGASPLMPRAQIRHGAPQYVIHRADLHKALMDEAESVAEIRVNSVVVSVDFDKPSVTLLDGTVLEADLIVGADGWFMTLYFEKNAENIRNEIPLSKANL
jgi:salicylate hydroxylase